MAHRTKSSAVSTSRLSQPAFKNEGTLSDPAAYTRARLTWNVGSTADGIAGGWGGNPESQSLSAVPRLLQVDNVQEGWTASWQTVVDDLSGPRIVRAELSWGIEADGTGVCAEHSGVAACDKVQIVVGQYIISVWRLSACCSAEPTSGVLFVSAGKRLTPVRQICRECYGLARRCWRRRAGSRGGSWVKLATSTKFGDFL